MYTKQNLIILFCLFISHSLFSQSESFTGKMGIGGALGLSTASSKQTSGGVSVDKPGTTAFEFTPSFRYFFSDKIAGEIGIGYSFSKDHAGTVDNVDYFNRMNQVSFAPRVYYYIPLGSQFYYNPNIFLGIGGGNIKYEQETRTSKYQLFNLGIGVRIVSFEFRPTDRVALGFACGSLAYNFNRIKLDNIKNQSHQFDLGINLSPTLSFSYYFQ